jgi:two-component system, NarL family, sensor kinase
MTGRLGLEGRNAPARLAALARVGLVGALVLAEALETGREPHDLAVGEPVQAVFLVYAVVAAVHAFRARRAVPVAPFLLADTLLLSLVVYAEGGAVADARFALFVPVVVAVIAGPRLTTAVAALSVAGLVAASVAHPAFGNAVSARLVAANALDHSWRAALAVVVSVLLTRRARRIAELAESRRALVAHALDAEARARRELSYVLHDELMQELLCAEQDVKAARRGRVQQLDRAQEALASSVRRLRHEIFHLHPHVLDAAGLEAALHAVAEDQALAGGGHPQIAVAPGASGFHDQLLFSVGRELLRNAVRHAGAGNVELTVERDGDRIVLCCRDDGCGIAPARPAGALADGHIGLAACTERVEALGGRLEIAGAPGGGTEIRVRVPAGEPGDEHAAHAPDAAAPDRRWRRRGSAAPSPTSPAIESTAHAPSSVVARSRSSVGARPTAAR